MLTLTTPSCFRFNTNGVIKLDTCLDHVGGGEPCDLYVLENAPQPAMLGDFPPIWPGPAKYTNGTATLPVSGSLKFSLSPATSNPTLEAAFARYQGLTFPHVSTASDVETVLENLFDEHENAVEATASPLAALEVKVTDLDESHPQVDTDESYTLSVPTSGSATLTAQTIYGAMRGLETFSQLVAFDFESESYVVENAPWTITDAPRFPHRGLMIDTVS